MALSLKAISLEDSSGSQEVLKKYFTSALMPDSVTDRFFRFNYVFLDEVSFFKISCYNYS